MSDKYYVVLCKNVQGVAHRIGRRRLRPRSKVVRWKGIDYPIIVSSPSMRAQSPGIGDAYYYYVDVDSGATMTFSNVAYPIQKELYNATFGQEVARQIVRGFKEAGTRPDIVILIIVGVAGLFGGMILGPMLGVSVGGP
jgi:hypothetical protein